MGKKTYDVNINIYFVLSEIMTMLFKDIEESMKKDKKVLKQKAKQNHRLMVDGYNLMKHAFIKNCEELNVLNSENWDAIHQDANDMLRIILLTTDRSGASRERNLMIERSIRRMKSQGIFSDEYIDKFRMK